MSVTLVGSAGVAVTDENQSCGNALATADNELEINVVLIGVLDFIKVWSNDFVIDDKELEIELVLSISGASVVTLLEIEETGTETTVSGVLGVDGGVAGFSVVSGLLYKMPFADLCS